MKHYKYTKLHYDDATSLTICISSLQKLWILDDADLQDYIVYIDEIVSFLELTHNDTLNSKLKEVFHLLSRIIRHAKKVIVSDALITDNVIEFLKHRNMDNAVIIENSFNKYLDVPAVRLRDENTFLEKLIQHCRDNDSFLFGCDSKKTVSSFLS